MLDISIECVEKYEKKLKEIEKDQWRKWVDFKAAIGKGYLRAFSRLFDDTKENLIFVSPFDNDSFNNNSYIPNFHDLFFKNQEIRSQ